METSSVTTTLIADRNSLTLPKKLAYSVGHVLNDLCASMWFTYLLVYLHKVLEFNNSLAGVLLLIGQVADGLATPFVGFESDRNDDFWLCRYGRRKTWHLFGTLCVLGSFPFLFMKCINCEYSSENAQAVYYAAFIVIFQFGWASVQISHLSLIPDLTTLSSERSALNSLRYAFTVISNVCIYGIAWLFLSMNRNEEELKTDQVGPHDNIQFRNIMLCAIGIGVVFSVLFHFGVKERPLSLEESVVDYQNGSINSGSLETTVHLRWKDWFKEGQFYKIGLLYMTTRLYVNLSQIYFPLYLQDTLGLHRKSIAIIPLVIYLNGFLASFIVNASNKVIGHKITYLLAATLAIGTSIWIYFGQGDEYSSVLIYVVASFVGIGGSAMLITSLAITSDLIGHNTSSGAFVFGAMSFLDKLSNGIVVMLIQYFHPCLTCCKNCKFYYAEILSIGCGSAAIFALVALAMLAPYRLQASIRTKTILIQSDEEEDQRYGVSRKFVSGSQINSSSPLLAHS